VWRLLLLTLLIATSAGAQDGSARIDSPSETDKLKDSCFNFKGLPGCAEELFTGQPLHIAVGSMPAQNGFGAGLAYVGHKTTENWRDSWDADAVGSINASWRAGVYFQFVHTPNKPIGVSFGPPKPQSNPSELPEHTVFGLYAQAISLNKLTYFGLGPSTTAAARTFYGMTQTVIGGNVVKPLYARLNASAYGQVNGRFVDLRPSSNQPSPSIQQIFTEATAPGLTHQPSALQLVEGVRIRPVFAADLVRLNYDFSYQQFVTPTNLNFSFQRLTIDLNHQFALYGKTTRQFESISGNGPDDCSVDPTTTSSCPKAYVRNLEGSLGLRFFTSLAMTPGADIVPFYFQPTLGGSDIDGNSSLGSYQDYRFRAPNVMLFRENFEHSIWTLPIGVTFIADEGKVALTRGSFRDGPWRHSFSAGLTLRAGGFPQMYLLFSWGGNEGTHTIASVNTGLLGGGVRPSLF
jgi:hypothetical protein